MALTIETIKLKRGSQSAVDIATLQKGEPAIALDTKSLWVGTDTGKIKISDVVVSSTAATRPPTGENNRLYLVITDEDFDNETTLYVWKAGAYVLVTSGTGTIVPGDIANLDSYIDNRISDEWRGENDGLAPLGIDGKIPNSYLPSLAITDVFTAATTTARDALTGVGTGDICIVDPTGTPVTYIYDGTQWLEMGMAPDGVLLINGMAGPEVTLTTDNISDATSSNKYFTDARAKTAVIDDSAGVGDSDVGWSANKIALQLDANDDILGSKAIDESNIAGGSVITYNSDNGVLEYHTILIDGGNL